MIQQIIKDIFELSLPFLIGFVFYAMNKYKGLFEAWRSKLKTDKEKNVAENVYNWAYNIAGYYASNDQLTNLQKQQEGVNKLHSDLQQAGYGKLYDSIAENHVLVTAYHDFKANGGDVHKYIPESNSDSNNENNDQNDSVIITKKTDNRNSVGQNPPIKPDGID